MLDFLKSMIHNNHFYVKTGFYKVSTKRFANDLVKHCADAPQNATFIELYKGINLPKFATEGSGGYDFFMPITLTINPGETVCVPSGIRVKLNEGTFLLCMPRSSLGVKHHISIANTVPLIDSDYYYADNEGHIMFFLVNNGDEPVTLNRGDRYVQGVVLPYLKLAHDGGKPSKTRTGGFGSTGK